MDLGFFSLPMGATPRDPAVGRDEFGRPVRQDALGARYQMAAQPHQDPTEAYMARVQGMGQPDSRAQSLRSGSGTVESPFKEYYGGEMARNAVAGLFDAAMQGVTAPGRAARGEPVTYGDTWATALDYGMLGAPMAAPEGALRANSFRAYHGTPDASRFDSPRVDVREPGSWWTPDKRYASDYAKGPEGRIFEADLTMDNPAVVTFDYDEYGDLVPFLDGEALDIDNNVDLVLEMRGRGYDGVVFPSGNFAEADETFVVFSDDQISLR